MTEQSSMASPVTMHPVRIQADGLGHGTLEVGGHDVSNEVFGFEVTGSAGSGTQVVLHARAGRTLDLDLEGVVTVVQHEMGADPHAISEWISRVAPGTLEQAALQRADLVNTKHGLAAAMLRTLAEWARGEGTPS